MTDGIVSTPAFSSRITTALSIFNDRVGFGGFEIQSDLL
jgi:hypothetical protein